MQRQWFDQILTGQKTKEYRDKTPFYISRLCVTRGGKIQAFKNLKAVIMQEGYHTGARRMTVEIRRISLASCFTIHLGEITEKNF